MPGVSTTTRSYPAARHAAMTSPRCSGSCPSARRVASDRKKTCDGSRSSIAFMRMRSPSSAPPPLRRVGSTASTAMRSLSSWSSRNRRTSSSVNELLPDPPVPVMPSTGAERCCAASCTAAARASSRPSSSTVIALASAAGSPASTWSACGPVAARSTSQAAMSSLIMPARPRRCPSSGAKIFTPRSASSAISSATITPPPPPNTCTCPAPTSASRSFRYVKYSTCPPWYDDSATPCTSSCTAAVTTASTLRSWPRWTTSAPCDCRIRRMTLIAASWPSNRLAAVTNRTGLLGTCRLIERAPSAAATGP